MYASVSQRHSYVIHAIRILVYIFSLVLSLSNVWNVVVLRSYVTAQVTGRFESLETYLAVQVRRCPVVHILQVLHALLEGGERLVAYAAYVRSLLVMVPLVTPEVGVRRANLSAVLAVDSSRVRVYGHVSSQSLLQHEALAAGVTHIIGAMVVHMLR